MLDYKKTSRLLSYPQPCPCDKTSPDSVKASGNTLCRPPTRYHTALSLTSHNGISNDCLDDGPPFSCSFCSLNKQGLKKDSLKQTNRRRHRDTFNVNQELEVLSSVSLLFGTFILYFDKDDHFNAVILCFNNGLQNCSQLLSFSLKKIIITIKNKLSNEMNEVTATRNICFYADELKEASMID